MIRYVSFVFLFAVILISFVSLRSNLCTFHIKREDNTFHLRILYTGIDRGELLPWDAPRFWGMTRRASVIEKLCMKNNLLIGNGVFIPSGPDVQLRKDILARIMKLMGYDAINASAPYISVEASVCANIEVAGEDVLKYVIKRFQGNNTELRVAIIGLTSEELLHKFEVYYQEVTILPMFDVLMEVLRKVNPLADLIIVLFQGSVEKAESLSQKVPNVDMIIYSDPNSASSSQERYQTSLNRPLIIDAGIEPNRLGWIDLKLLHYES